MFRYIFKIKCVKITIKCGYINLKSNQSTRLTLMQCHCLINAKSMIFFYILVSRNSLAFYLSMY